MRIVIGEVDVDGDVYKMRHGVNMTVPDEDLMLSLEEFSKQYLYPAFAQLIQMHNEAMGAEVKH